MSTIQKPHIDKDKLKQKLDVSHFDLNAVLRGAQLTLVGGNYVQPSIAYMPFEMQLISD